MASDARKILQYFPGNKLSKMITKILKIILLIFLFWSCSDEPVETIFFNLDNQNGVFISCEGNFMYGNSSLSFYNTESKKITNQLFYARNNAPLGDVAQSLSLVDNTLFIVINNSGKVYAVDPQTIEFKGVITGLVSPRYMHFINPDKVYISDLYANHITIVNPKTYQVTGEIEVPNHTSEQMVQLDSLLFVSSWSYDEYILVINLLKDKLIGEIKVPFQPKDLIKDFNNKIWVLSEGSPEGFTEKEELPALSRLDPQTLTIEQIYRFEEGEHPHSLEINQRGDTIFYINKDIYRMPIKSRQLPQESFIKANGRLFYSMGLSPKNGEIYISDAIDYTQNGVVYRYTHNGNLIDSFKVGINPSDFLFR